MGKHKKRYAFARYHLRRPNMRFYRAPREEYDFSMTLERRKWVFTQFIDFHCRRKKMALSFLTSDRI